jgi:hypothetical protein
MGSRSSYSITSSLASSGHGEVERIGRLQITTANQASRADRVSVSRSLLGSSSLAVLLPVVHAVVLATRHRRSNVTDDLEAFVIRWLLKDRCEMPHRSFVDAVSVSWRSGQAVASSPDGCVDRHVQEVHHRVKPGRSGPIERICPSPPAPMVQIEDHVDPEP